MERNTVKNCFLAFLFLIVLIAPAQAEMSDWSSRWNYTTDGGVAGIAIDDINGDGFPEVVAATTASTLISGGAIGTSSWLYVFDKDGNFLWNKGSSVFGGKITSIMIGDLEGDGKKEIIVGSGSYVHFFDGEGNEEQKINIAKYGFEVTNIVIADVNNDKVNEIVIGGRTADAGSIWVYNNKKQRLFYTPETQQSLTAFYAGDLNNDGAYEYAVGTTGKWITDPAFVYEYNSVGILLWSNKTKAAVKSMTAEDIDGDKIPELLAGGNGFVYAFDGAGNLKKNGNLSGAVVNKLIAYDIYNDGTKEIVAGGNFLFLLDKNLEKKWKSETIFGEMDAIEFYDLNNDGFPEILASGSGLHIFNKEGTETDSIYPQASIKDFVLADLNYDDYPEIVLGIYTGSKGRLHAMGSQHMVKATNASRLYQKALGLLNSGSNLTGAEELAREAQKQFNNLGDKTGAANSKDLLTRIVAAQGVSENLKKDADSYYDKAANAYTANDMVAALENAKIARAKYYQINDTEDINRCDNMIIRPASEQVKILAAESLSKAQAYYDNKNYNDALSYSNKSLGLYELLNDASGTEKSRMLFEQAGKAGGNNPNVTSQSKPLFPSLDANTQNMLMFGGVGLVLLVILLYLFSVVRKRRSTPHLKLVLADDDRKETLLDEVDKDERAKGRKHPKKEEKVVDKPVERKKDAWIDVRNVEHEKREVFEYKEDPNHIKAPLPALKEKKRLEKITKDGFVGLGVSLANLGVKKTAEMKKSDEEDISD